MTEAPAAEATEDDLGDAVTLAYVAQNTVGNAWHYSMTQLLGYDMAHQARILRGEFIAIRYGTDGLPEARNKAVEEFLARDVPWLLWLDTDMGFQPHALEQLIAVADPLERPIVGGLCFTQRETHPDDMGGWRCTPTPTVFDWRHEPGGKQGFTVRWDYPRDAVVRCAGTGSAAVLIHRTVFERIFSRYGRTWYDRAFNPTMEALVSEDLSFCMKAVALGIPVHVHTGVKTSHQKTLWLSEEDYLDGRAPEPAAAECAVLVPVLRRPQNAEPFMRSLRASTGLARAYAIADDSDDSTQEAWRAAGATVIRWADDDGPGTFAEKVNAGYRRTGGGGLDVPEPAAEPWLLLVGDDVRFHPGWLDHAVAAAGDRYHVVGTNDLGNPRVTSGEHATHLLVRRKYADGWGASWDGPGVIAHEGYRHWYVDDEIVTAAKARGVWTPCLRSKVEHLHPLFGKAPGDDVYEFGAKHADEDRALFEQRCKEYL